MTISVQQPPENDNGNLGGGEGAGALLGRGQHKAPPPPDFSDPLFTGTPSSERQRLPLAVCLCSAEREDASGHLAELSPSHPHTPAPLHGAAAPSLLLEPQHFLLPAL
ncbi:hypothetical protein KIL84_019183 [Mauremys mutica]|uniref:Uncharacterized protein n=1 Tax=Mauremys mutica TaxID=74926 RepID=A0A9D4BB02_9SAUR|nr:hypothetical protein KIL84_019183 [Mauremys mutica]